MRSCSFIHTFALFPDFKICSAFSCSQSSTFEIASLFQPCSAQASAFLILPATFNLVLLRSPSPQDYVGCFESLSAIYYPFIAFRAVSLSNISTWCMYLPSWTSWYYYTLSRSLVFGRTAWDVALAVLGVIPTFRQLPSDSLATCLGVCSPCCFRCPVQSNHIPFIYSHLWSQKGASPDYP